MSFNPSENIPIQKHSSLYFEDGNLVIKVCPTPYILVPPLIFVLDWQIKGNPIHFNLYRGRCRKASGLISAMVPAEPPVSQSNLNTTTDVNQKRDEFQETNKGIPSDPLVLSCPFEEFELAAAWMLGDL